MIGLQRDHYRAVFLLLLLIGTVPSADAYLSRDAGDTRGGVPAEVPPRDGITVVTSDAWGPMVLAAYAPNGSLLYYNDSYIYHDVDPSPIGRTTVLYVGSTTVPRSECPALIGRGIGCQRNVVERVNLTTGETTRIWSETLPRFPWKTSTNIHDVDAVGSSRLLIGHIAWPDRVYLHNLTTGTKEWGWEVQSHYPLSSGGVFPGDWTHLNDVEMLDGGRVMVSLRNQDQVVFIHPDRGLAPNWTLGRDDDHGTLFEQHNPDYIPTDRGGPAILVADSGNRRAIEYQRVNGSWEQTWLWQDSRLQSPRDADRLPNGHTLITDSAGDRLLEVDTDGEIVWRTEFPGPYEAERLGTGDESAGGPSATAADLASRTSGFGGNEGVDDRRSFLSRLLSEVRGILPNLLVDGILFVLPQWATPTMVLGLGFQGVVAVIWAVFEARWTPYTVQVRLTKSE